jgi:hypothetical protein
MQQQLELKLFYFPFHSFKYYTSTHLNTKETVFLLFLNPSLRQGLTIAQAGLTGYVLQICQEPVILLPHPSRWWH